MTDCIVTYHGLELVVLYQTTFFSVLKTSFSQFSCYHLGRGSGKKAIENFFWLRQHEISYERPKV